LSVFELLRVKFNKSTDYSEVESDKDADIAKSLTMSSALKFPVDKVRLRQQIPCKWSISLFAG
jgi:hypothetical protein